MRVEEKVDGITGSKTEKKRHGGGGGRNAETSMGRSDWGGGQRKPVCPFGHFKLV